MQYFEDIELEQPIKGGSYELTESEIIEFAKKWDPLPFHIDKEAAEQTVYGGLIASGVHLSCVSCRCAHDLEEQQAVIAALGAESKSGAPGRHFDIRNQGNRKERIRIAAQRWHRCIPTLPEEPKSNHCSRDKSHVDSRETKRVVFRKEGRGRNAGCPGTPRTDPGVRY